MGHIHVCTGKAQFGSLLQATGRKHMRGLITIGVVGVLYVLLSAATKLPANAATANAQPPAGVRQEVTPTLPAEGGDAGAETGDGLSPAFLGEYDRLAGGNAATPASADNGQTTTGGSLGGTLLFSLLIVAGLAYAGVWGYQQIVRRKGGALPQGGKHLLVEETQAIGPNQKLHLVRMGEELLLLGATDHQITCLARYDAEHFGKSFDAHLHSAEQSASQAPTMAAPVPLHESLNELRKVQRWQRGDDHA